jgi:copper chaperone CopZ
LANQDPSVVGEGQFLALIRDIGYDVPTAKADLPVTGMTRAGGPDAGCAMTIERALKCMAGIVSATVSFASERASVEYLPGVVGLAAIQQAIHDAGYDDVAGEGKVVELQNRKPKGWIMGRKHGWLTVLLIVGLLMAACGPEMATPTPHDEAAAGDADAPTKAPVAESPTKVEEKEPTKEPESSGEAPAEAEDWHILGSPEAPVTIIEYADFQ